MIRGTFSPGTRILLIPVVLGVLISWTACGGGGSSANSINPPTVNLSAISVTPVNTSIVLGTPLQFTATGTYSDGTTKDITSSVSWATASTDVLTISTGAGRQGLATGRAVGTSVVTATLNSISGSTAAHVITLLPRFAIVANHDDGTLSLSTINAVTGQWRTYGYSPIHAPYPLALALDPQGKSVYVISEFSTDSIWGYTLDTKSGTFTPIPGSPFPTGHHPTRIAIDPSGRFLYVTNRGSNDVSAFAISSNTGALSAIPGPFPSGNAAWAAIIDPQGKFLYVTNAMEYTVSAFSISGSGALTRVGTPFKTGAAPMAIAIDPSGQFLYVANSVDNTISGYSIDGNTGALTSITGSPFASAVGPAALAVDPSGKFLFVANGGANTVGVYSIDISNGTLTSVGTPAVAGQSPISIAVDPSGKFVFTANLASRTISAYSFDSSTGSLSPKLGTHARSGPTAIALVNSTPQSNNPISYIPRALYAADDAPPYGSSTLSAFTINATSGALAGSVSSYGTGGSPAVAVATDLHHRFLYSANLWSNNIGGFRIDGTTGNLTQILGSPFVAPSPYGLAIEPSGRFLYAADYYSAVHAFHIDASSGALVELPNSPFATEAGPSAVSVDPTGQFLYVLNNAGASISGFRINPLTGEPVPMAAAFSAVTPVGYPQFVTVDPTGSFLYVAIIGDWRGDSSSFLAFKIDSQSGTLTPLANSPFISNKNPVALVAHPNGNWMYVAGTGVNGYAITPPEGDLVAIPGATVSMSGPASYLTFEGSGRYLYLGHATGITGFTVDSSSGALTTGPSYPFPSGVGVRAMTSTSDVQ